ncbi:MAG: hypothetical protein JNM31_04135 [Flavobacteriales bacterium]|nr:hypothetical protein [Flavobacteriales bacterium]
MDSLPCMVHYATWVALVNVAVALAEGPVYLGAALLLLGPLIVLLLVYRVLTDRSASVPDLKPGHDWDYLDRPDRD